MRRKKQRKDKGRSKKEEKEEGNRRREEWKGKQERKTNRIYLPLRSTLRDPSRRG